MLGWSNFATFLVGVGVGAAGQYFADKYTDQRREKERRRALRSAFDRLAVAVPNLIDEIRADLRSDASASAVREFFVLPSSGNSIGFSDKRRFEYYENQHDGLRVHLDLFIRAGLLADVTPTGNRTPIYSMSEEFVALVLSR